MKSKEPIVNFQYKIGSCKNAEYVCKRIVNIPVSLSNEEFNQMLLYINTENQKKKYEHFCNSFKNSRVLVTGHTGFKGSWLSLWLSNLGAEVVGISNNIPTTPLTFSSYQIR